MREAEDFTPEATRRWAALPARTQTLLLNNVWCVECGRTTTIVRYGGRMERGQLVLLGHCQRCEAPVARVIEGSQ